MLSLNKFLFNKAIFIFTLAIFFMHISVQQVSSADQSFCKENPGAPGCQPKPKPKYKPKTKHKQSTPRKKYKGLKNTIRNDNTKKTYKSLQQAINEARKGHLIVIGPGTYEYDQTITISGKDNLIIAGTDDGDENAVSAIVVGKDAQYGIEIVGSTNITIHDLYIGHTTRNDNNLKGALSIDNSQNIYLLNNTITGSEGGGVFAFNSNKITIEDNIIYYNSNAGVLLGGCSDVNIYSNTINDNGVSIFFTEMQGYLSIKYNSISDNNTNDIIAHAESNLDAIKISDNYFGSAEKVLICSECSLGSRCDKEYSNNDIAEVAVRCESKKTKICYDDNVYWQDSCGNRESIYEYCDSNESCNKGRCVSHCTSKADTFCMHNMIYWEDSCGNIEDVKFSCPSNSQCAYGDRSGKCTCVDGYQAKDGKCVQECEKRVYKTCFNNKINWVDSCGNFELAFDCPPHSSCKDFNNSGTCYCESGYSAQDGKCVSNKAQRSYIKFVCPDYSQMSDLTEVSYFLNGEKLKTYFTGSCDSYTVEVTPGVSYHVETVAKTQYQNGTDKRWLLDRYVKLNPGYTWTTTQY